MLTKKVVTNKLDQVLDPELGISIVELGLIYDISIKGKDVSVLMTLTFPGCPLASVIQKEVEEKLKKIDEVGKINVALTFDPPWDSSKIAKSAKEKLGII
jgi:Predicted metal-sulfur cluster biosynthetic enzyme